QPGERPLERARRSAHRLGRRCREVSRNVSRFHARGEHPTFRAEHRRLLHAGLSDCALDRSRCDLEADAAVTARRAKAAAETGIGEEVTAAGGRHGRRDSILSGRHMTEEEKRRILFELFQSLEKEFGVPLDSDDFEDALEKYVTDLWLSLHRYN